MECVSHYEWDDTRLVEKIHASAAYGDFVEIGAGQPIADALFRVSGASSTIRRTSSPYAKTEQDARYQDIKGARYVGHDRVAHILDAEASAQTNLVVATSFTLATDACCHGYIGISYNPNIHVKLKRVYHVTLPQCYTRAERIALIGHIGVRLLGLVIRMAQYPIMSISAEPFLNYIDDVRNTNKGSLRRELLDLYYMHNHAAHEQSVTDHMTHAEHALVFLPDIHESAERFEILCRKNTTLIPFKGSFSILHNMHLGMAETVQHDGDRRQVIFTICINTFGKGIIDIEDLNYRILMILKAGYPVMILQFPLFSENFLYLRSRIDRDKNEIIFIAGADTVERLAMTNTRWIDQSGVHFAWFDREGNGSCPYHGQGRTRFQKYDLTQVVASRDLLRAVEINDFDTLRINTPAHVAQYFEEHKWRPERIHV